MFSDFVRNYFALLQAERWTHGRRNEARLAALNKLLRDAYAHVPLYHDLYPGPLQLETLTALSELPPVTKDDLRASFPDRLLNSRFDIAKLYPIATSGTSNRVMIFQDETKRDWDRAADLLLKFRTERLGRVLTIPPDDCYERCGLNGAQTTSWRATVKGALIHKGRARIKARREFLSRIASKVLWNDRVMAAPGVDGTAVADAVIDRYFDAIGEVRPATIKAFPYYFWMLAKRARGRDLSPCKVVRPSGGKASSYMIDEIERQLGVRFRDNYGTAELGTISVDDESTRAQVLIEPLFIVEFIRHGRPVANGELGEIYITDLRNHACPLIRYRVGDVGRVVHPASGSERGALQFEVCGRMDETIVTRQGHIVPPDVVIDAFLEIDGIDFCRLLQKDDLHFLLEVVPGSMTIDEVRAEAALRRLLREPEAMLTLRRVRRISPEGSGKYKLVGSRSYGRFHETGKTHVAA